MSKVFPFKTLPRTAAKEIIGNEAFGTIEMPRYGCLTVSETQAVTSLLRKLTNKEADTIDIVELQLGCAALALQSRVEECKDWTIEDIRKEVENPEGQIRWGLIEAIYEFFFQGERNKWQPKVYSLMVEGNGAEVIAVEQAKKTGGVAATSKLEDGSVWFVFKSMDAVPEEYKVAGVEEAIASDEPVVSGNGKVSEETGKMLTGLGSTGS